MSPPTYWPYALYIVSGVLLLIAGVHPAWMLVPLTCACIAGAYDNYYLHHLRGGES